MRTPIIDPRTRQQVIQMVKEMAPHYTPEWRFSPDDPDPGTALAWMVADMLEENIHRLNKLPHKQFVSFLNLLNTSLLSARPAQAHLTFKLNEGTRQPVHIPKGTQVGAAVPGLEESVMFETEKALHVTNAKIQQLLEVSYKQDSIRSLPTDIFTSSNGQIESSQMAPIELFGDHDAEQMQEHSLFIGHESVLNIVHPAVIEIRLLNEQRTYDLPQIAEKLSHADHMEWSYLSSEQEWVPFDEVTAQDHHVRLTKQIKKPLVRDSVYNDSDELFWIRAKVKRFDTAYQFLSDGQLEMDGLQLQSRNLPQEGLAIGPDLLFQNDIEENADGCYPFSPFFAPYGLFYLASQEVFSKKDGQVSIAFNMKAIRNQLMKDKPPDIKWKMVMKRSDFAEKEKPRISIELVYWEYWNGQGWVRLDVSEEQEQLFHDLSEEEIKGELHFNIPTDMEETYVNSHLNYWIRGRVISIENLYETDGIYLSPWLSHFQLSYSYSDMQPLEACHAKNNGEWQNLTGSLLYSRTATRPFFPVENQVPALYMRFDEPPVGGPVSMYFSMTSSNRMSEQPPYMEWQYLSRQGAGAQWVLLKTRDETDGLYENGTVQFSAPPDFVKRKRFGQEGYWIRVMNRDEKLEREDFSRPRLAAIYMNTVNATQQETVLDEFPDPLPDAAGHVFQLNRKPIMNEQVWVDETGQRTEEEWEEFARHYPDQIEWVKDSAGILQRVWIKWEHTENLLHAKGQDRYYELDRAAGQLRFGDGTTGKALPVLGSDAVRVNYRVVQGKYGNVPRHAIQQLQQSIAFIESVTNMEPAAGGTDVETLPDALQRGPQKLKHRGRAVTTEDFEWLIREAYPAIAKVTCLSAWPGKTSGSGASLAVVLLPESGLDNPAYLSGLKKQVRTFLLDKASAMIAFSDQLEIMEAAWIEISVQAEIVIHDMDESIPAEVEAVERLEAYLDPFTGNEQREGWDIGQTVHISQFYALLKKIHAVNYVHQCKMSMHRVEKGQRVEISNQQWEQTRHGVIRSGKHTVMVRVQEG
ncbi:baseplate J/gp47 family protein [Marinicrinis sediminis]|uniref:Baseplate J/gp47 family protein n=1 Tax=Marinicrinis sediminis TaxID=1652465 RepID=A0ABW5REQ9_9BACL